MGDVQEPGISISASQRRILGLLAAGQTNRQIAATTGLAEATVKWHVSQMLAELGVESRSDAADWWRERHGVRRRRWQEAAPSTVAGQRVHSGAMEMTKPIVMAGAQPGGFSVGGSDLMIEEWQGSAPGELHVHHRHDIAWHVIAGALAFRFADERVMVPAGSTLFVPAGVPHTYGEGDDARYLVIGHPRLFELFVALRTARMGRPHTDWGAEPDAEIYRQYESELLESR